MQIGYWIHLYAAEKVLRKSAAHIWHDPKAFRDWRGDGGNQEDLSVS